MIVELESEASKKEKVEDKNSDAVPFIPWTGQKWSKYTTETEPAKCTCDESVTDEYIVWSGQTWNKYA